MSTAQSGFDVVFDEPDVVAVRHVDGVVSDVVWASMGDYPMFTLLHEHGHRTEWTRHGDPRRFVIGLNARLAFSSDDRLTSIALEHSDQRSSGLEIGPGSAGLRRVRALGTTVWWIVFADEASMTRAAALLSAGYAVENRGERGSPDARWMLRVVGDSAEHLRHVMKDTGGSCDGYEAFVDGRAIPDVFGPTAL